MTGHVEGDRIQLREAHRFDNRPVHLGDTLCWNVPALWREVVEGVWIGGPRLSGIGIDTGCRLRRGLARHCLSGARRAFGRRRFAYISRGTGSLVGPELPTPNTSPEPRAANFTNEVGVDGTVRFLRNLTGPWLLTQSLRQWELDGVPHELEPLLAAEAEAPEVVRSSDTGRPEFTRGGDVPTMVGQECDRTGQPAPQQAPAVVRCTLDSLAAAYPDTIRDAVRVTGRQVSVVHSVGGGRPQRVAGAADCRRERMTGHYRTGEGSSNSGTDMSTPPGSDVDAAGTTHGPVQDAPKSGIVSDPSAAIGKPGLCATSQTCPSGSAK